MRPGAGSREPGAGKPEAGSWAADSGTPETGKPELAVAPGCGARELSGRFGELVGVASWAGRLPTNISVVSDVTVH
jgi:hypothetical protein